MFASPHDKAANSSFDSADLERFMQISKMARLVAVMFALCTQSGRVVAFDDRPDLKAEILKMDRQLFEKGFNQCDLEAFSAAIDDDFEFYHDQGGIDATKADFIRKFVDNICNGAERKPTRKLVPETTVIEPLSKDGVLYGVLQQGDHNFYLSDGETPPTLTSTAKFLHLWLKVGDGWKSSARSAIITLLARNLPCSEQTIPPPYSMMTRRSPHSSRSIRSPRSRSLESREVVYSKSA